MENLSNFIIEELLHFLEEAPTSWHAADFLTKQALQHGFTLLQEGENWNLKPGNRYCVVRHSSFFCAFITPRSLPEQVRLLTSHTDSPGLKLKPQPELRRQGVLLLGTEIYGAPLLSSWLNRDLGLAGRVFYEKNQQLKEALVCLKRYPVTIPQLAIHLDREVNEKGLILNKQEHLYALAALDMHLPSSPYVDFLVQQEIKEVEKILSTDLFLYPLEPPRLIGYNQQFITSYRIDSLASVQACSYAFFHQSEPLENEIKMIAFSDHEEVGSGSTQGAESPFISQVLERIVLSYQLERSNYLRLLPRSFCVSVDLAHAVHPNYPEKHDALHAPLLGRGFVLKTNAQQRYASNAHTLALVRSIAQRHHQSIQMFVSRNDMPCGTTIGPLHASQLGIPTVDIGCGQLSMHSSRELLAVHDHLELCQFLYHLLG